VMNAGNGGKGTDYALRFFETIGQELKPALTLLFFFANDYVDNGRSVIYDIAADGSLRVRPDVGSVYARKEFLRGSSVYNWFISWSHVANLLKRVAVGYLRPSVERDDGPDAVVAYPDVNTGWSNVRNARRTQLFLEGLARAVREAGSDLIVFYVPGADEISRYRNGRALSKDETTFLKLAGSNRGAVISLTAMLAGSGEPLEQLYFDEAGVGRPSGHWTPTGHRLVAGFVERVATGRLKRRLGN
ncbi:MAG: hypothetical protein ACT4P5_06725, partial [Armatimonadota bacterium]